MDVISELDLNTFFADAIQLCCQFIIDNNMIDCSMMGVSIEYGSVQDLKFGVTTYFGLPWNRSDEDFHNIGYNIHIIRGEIMYLRYVGTKDEILKEVYPISITVNDNGHVVEVPPVVRVNPPRSFNCRTYVRRGYYKGGKSRGFKENVYVPPGIMFQIFTYDGIVHYNNPSPYQTVHYGKEGIEILYYIDDYTFSFNEGFEACHEYIYTTPSIHPVKPKDSNNYINPANDWYDINGNIIPKNTKKQWCRAYKSIRTPANVYVASQHMTYKGEKLTSYPVIVSATPVYFKDPPPLNPKSVIM